MKPPNAFLSDMAGIFHGRRRGGFLALVVVTLAGASVAARAAAELSPAAQLRQKARLPMLHFTLGFHVSTRHGILLIQSRPELQSEIAALEAQLRGSDADAPLLGRLARLHEQNDSPAKAAEAARKAAALWRKRLEQQPENAEALRQLGNCLTMIQETAEAEVMLRRAVKAGATDWQAWADLGHFLSGRAFVELVRHLPEKEQTSVLWDMATKLRQNRPSAVQMAQLEVWLKEAESCLDKAVAAAPTLAEPYLRRSEVKSMNEVTRFHIASLEAEKFDVLAFGRVLAAPGAREDLRRATELDPKNFRAVTMAALAEFFSLGLKQGSNSLETLLAGSFFPNLAEAEKEVIRAQMRRLAALGEEANPTRAAAALEILGSLQLLIRDYAGAEKSLRRAIQLHPALETGWDALMSLLVDRGHWPELVALAEARLKAKQTARNAVALAKALDRNGQAEAAVEAARQAVALDPKSFLAQHALAAALTKAAKDGQAQRQARLPLSAAAELITDQLPIEDRVHFGLTCAIHNALVGDFQEALGAVEAILKAQKDNQEAREIELLIRKLERLR